MTIKHIANQIIKTSKGTLSFNGLFFIFRYKAVWGDGGGTEIDKELNEFYDKIKSATDEFNTANKSNLVVNKGKIVPSHYGMMAETTITGVNRDNEIVNKYLEFMKSRGMKVK